MSLYAAAELVWALEDLERTERLCSESLELFRELGDKVGQAEALIGLASVAAMRGDFVAARDLYQEIFLILQRIQYRERSGPLSVWRNYR